MKKLFTTIAIASMMLTTAFSFTSCQKDEVPTTSHNDIVSSINSKYNTDKTEDSATDPFTNMGGTWEYTDADGVKYSLEFSGEGKNSSAIKFSYDNKKYALAATYMAKLTVGDKTYNGKFLTGIFLGTANGVACSITAQTHLTSVSANSFTADIKVKGETTAYGATFTKVK